MRDSLKLLLLKAGSNNNVLRVFIDKLSHHLSLIDAVNATVLDLLAHPKALTIAFCSQFDAVISFNAVGTNFTEVVKGQEVNVFNYLSLKHLCWMVDDPVYHFSRLLEPNPHRITLFTSELHIRTAEDFQFAGRFGQALGAGSIRQTVKAHALRTYDIAIAASWMGEPEPFWLDYEASLQNIVLSVIEQVKQSPICNAYPFLKAALFAEDLWLSETGLFEYVLTDIHSYMRKLDRLAIIRKLVDSGLSVALIGTGWKPIFSTKSNVTYFEDTNYSDIKKIYEDARVVVNLNAENGACERVFDGIESGAMIFSDFSNALYRAFSHDQGVMFYQKHKADESISGLLRIIEQNETQGFADQAQQVVLAGHTWQYRAQALYELLQHLS
jgi:hypothetical protein